MRPIAYPLSRADSPWQTDVQCAMLKGMLYSRCAIAERNTCNGLVLSCCTKLQDESPITTFSPILLTLNLDTVCLEPSRQCMLLPFCMSQQKLALCLYVGAWNQFMRVNIKR